MPITHRTISTEEGLKRHIQSGEPSLYCCSKTSTVVDFSKLDAFLKPDQNLCVVDLSGQAKAIELMPGGILKVRGPVTWQEANTFVTSQGNALKTVPSEPLACIIAGCATSASGERGFGFGSFRDQIKCLSYFDDHGLELKLSAAKSLAQHSWFQPDTAQRLLSNYQAAYSSYRQFKNGPVPRLEKESDLMLGSEGQLGVVMEVEFETTPLIEQVYLMLQLPRWEQEFDIHLAFFAAVQDFRDCLFSCEFVDHNSIRMANPAGKFPKGVDLIFLQIDSRTMEHIVSDLLNPIRGLDQARIFQIPESDFLALRSEVPRQIAEKNRLHRMIKKGTDIQVAPKDFPKLWERYRQAAKLGVSYRLFGHFGDAHLHFNFLPQAHQADLCDSFLDDLYAEVRDWGATPSAEHGIGLVKQARIDPFLTLPQRQMFAFLKTKMDPGGKFFPQGFMSTAARSKNGETLQL